MRNIIYLHTHDTGRYIQPYGYAVETPQLMRLAGESTLFRHAYSGAPTCSPSRASLLTGTSAHGCGMIGLVNRGFGLSSVGRERHLARFLQQQGYETALCGVQHESPQGQVQQLGYKHVLAGEHGAGLSRDRANAHAAAEFLAQSHEQPFFLAFGMINTHREYPQLDGSINPDYVMPPSPLYDTAETREDFARYILSVREVDACVGIVLDALARSDAADETIVVFTTDHGLAFPHMKCNLTDHGIGVSLMLKYPGNPAAGRAVDALVSHLDVYPTLCELTGLNGPEWLEGHSLAPLLDGRVASVRDEVFAEVTYHAAYEPMRVVRTERYKLIRRFDPHGRVVPANIDDGLSKQFLIDHGFLQEERPSEELFDVYLDPAERVNRLDDPQLAHIRRDLSDRLQRWMKETHDPLLDATPVPMPPGARANSVDDLSPKAPTS